MLSRLGPSSVNTGRLNDSGANADHCDPSKITTCIAPVTMRCPTQHKSTFARVSRVDTFCAFAQANPLVKEDSPGRRRQSQETPARVPKVAIHQESVAFNV